MTVIVEEDQINTPTCSPRAFIRQCNQNEQCFIAMVGLTVFGLVECVWGGHVGCGGSGVVLLCVWESDLECSWSDCMGVVF